MRSLRCVFVLLAAFACAGVLAAPRGMPVKTKPVWDLVSDGKGPIALSSESAFELPQETVRDASAFAVRVEIEFGKDWNADEQRLVKVVSQRIGETGWAIALGGAPKADGGNVAVDVGGELLRDGKVRFIAHPGETHSFAIRSREGVVSLFVDDLLQHQWVKRVVPNLEPVVVGRTDAESLAAAKAKEWKGLTLKSLSVYGPDEPFAYPGEKNFRKVGTRSGKGWFIDAPVDDSDKSLQKILCYGDSIMLGYSPGLRKALEGKAYVYGWCAFRYTPGPVEEDVFRDVSSSEPFDYIFFNNGLHSLHWSEAYVPDAKVVETYRSLVRAFRKGAPKAKLIYLTTTPLLAASPKGQPATAVGPRNETVLRLNRIATKVMSEEGVEVIDLYARLIDHLDYANGGADVFHWNKEKGYPTIYQAIAARVLGTKGDAAP